MDFDQRQMRGGVGARSHLFERPGSDIKKSGYLKKLKTNKKKFFVLRSTSSSGPARLEYYDSEKKFRAPNGQLPKRSIQLHTCFNINRHADSRHCKNGIVLYTSEDSFIVVADSLEEQESWLSVLLEYQYEYMPDGDEHREHYEHVWLVMLQPKGLGNKSNKGQYRMCLNGSSVSLIKTSSTKPQYIIQLPTIRNIAQSECSFCMEVGKYASTGEGKFWFHVDDTDIVKDMHDILHHYMNNKKDSNIKKDTSFRARSESHSSMSPNHRRSSKAEQRPASFYTSGYSGYRSSMDTTSPGSVSSSFGPSDHSLGAHRPRSDTGDSRISRGSSRHEDGPDDFFLTSYKNGDMHDSMKTKELNVVPPDMSPPPSPKMFEEQLSAYLEMDASIHSNQSGGSNSMSGIHHPTPSLSSPGSVGSSYMAMSPHSQSSSVKGDLSPSLPDSSPSAGSSYMSMAQSVGGGSHFGGHTSAPIPIHPHVSSHPPHPTPLPTVREGGSTEGYLPMEASSSPATPSNLRPEPVKCMLSLDNDSPSMGLPPRTYSLGSKPVGKKGYSGGYMDMGGPGGAGGGHAGSRKGSLSNDNMLRATSAPHIIHKGRRDRDRDRDRDQHGGTDSPIPSPLSMSIKSDDSDSFMEYMPMRPRTASDSYNYRPRTSSQGKLQPMCRPRSSSHGQGTRPITKFSSRMTQDAAMAAGQQQHGHHRVPSKESSLHDSFDSLRVSNESLRRMSQDLRHSPTVNVGDGEITLRVNTPPPLSSSSVGKNSNNNNNNINNISTVKTDSSGKELVDSYMSMDLASNLHHHHHHKSSSSSSPHRVRTDSNSSGSSSLRPVDFLASPSPQDGSSGSDYAEMGPVGHTSRSGSYSSGSKMEADNYMNMGMGGGQLRHPTTHNSPVLSTSLQSPSVLSDMAYVNMSLDNNRGSSARRSDSVRSASVENVESYIMYDPAPLNSGNKLRTGSVGSKDKKVSLRVSAAKSHFQQTQQQQQQPINVSASTKKGGSSDSIRKPTRQSSMEKYGSLGKDFRKKSSSIGSRPMASSSSSSSKMTSSSSGGGDGHHNHLGFNLVPIRKSTRNGGAGVGGGGEESPDDEYIEFSPNAYRDGTGSVVATTDSGTPTINVPSTVVSPLSSHPHHHLHHHHHHQQQQQQSSSNADDYTPFAPAKTKEDDYTPFAPAKTKEDDYTPFAPAKTKEDDYTPFAPAKTKEDDYTPFAPASSSDDYTPFAPASSNDDYTPFSPDDMKEDDDYSMFAPFCTIPNTDFVYTATSASSTTHNNRNQSVRQDDSDYTPFAPVGGSGTVSTTPYKKPSPLLPSSSSSFSSSSSSSTSSSKHSSNSSSSRKQQQPSPKEEQSDYVGYNPSPRLPPSNPFPALSYHHSNSASHPTLTPSSSSSSSPLSSTKNPKVQHHSSLDSSSRRGSNSTNVSGGVHASTSLTFNNSMLSKSTTATSSSSNPSITRSITTISSSSTSSSSSSSSSNPPLSLAAAIAASSSHPLRALLSYAAPQAPQPKKHKEKTKTEDDSEYLSYNPAKPKISSTTTACSGSASSPIKASSLIQTNESNKNKPNTPLTVDVSSSSSTSSSSSRSSSSPALPKNESNNSSSNSTTVSQATPVLRHYQPAPPSPLSCITTAYLSSCNTMTTTTSNNNNNKSQMSPSCHSSSPSPQPPSPLPTVSEDNPPPWNLNSTPPATTTTTSSSSSSSTRQKHASGSSTSSQKSRRISGDSSSENINIAAKPLGKSGSKSDSNSSLSSSSGSKNSNNGSGSGRRRAPSGDKTPQSSGSAEKSPLLSPSGRVPWEEFFCGSPSQCSGKSLEAKMVPVESKIRHSIGDVTTLPSSTSSLSSNNSGGEGSSGSGGLIRPGSSPCFQQTDPNAANTNTSNESGSGGPGGEVGNESLGSDSSGSGGQRLSSSSSSSTSGQQASGSSSTANTTTTRSRHSLSDLGAYQQMTFGGGGSSSHESGGSGGSGSGDSYGSGGGGGGPMGSNSGGGGGGGKPLNYAQLDLSASGSGGSISGVGGGVISGCGGGGCGSGSGGGSNSGSGGSGSAEGKSRNLSDGDERQPPLSYAKIDFVKSQNMNKVMGGGSGSGSSGNSSGDANTSKT